MCRAGVGGQAGWRDHLQGSAIVGDIDADLVTVAHLAAEQLAGELVAHRGLYQAAQRPCPVHRVESALGEPTAGVVTHLQAQPAVGEAGTQPVELQADDRLQGLDLQRLEDQDVVEPVEELGLKCVAHRRHHRLAPPLGRQGQVDQVGRAQIRGEHED